jgi:hypothetical protein
VAKIKLKKCKIYQAPPVFFGAHIKSMSPLLSIVFIMTASMAVMEFVVSVPPPQKCILNLPVIS